MLPELIRRLIETSVTSVDRLSFPSGDAVSVHGWDGIVSCNESIDLVPEGVSLWECGATKDKQGKIKHDFGVREDDSLGYDKSTSTFVLVTPRIWEGADEWMREHQNGWKKVVVYTAVELERWIENRPSVGMWLAEKLRILPSGGYMLPETYWNRWAQGEKMTLPYEIILPGREEISQRIVDTCKTPSSLVIQALSQSEGVAFAIASIMTCKESESLKSRMVVVTEKSAFDDLVEHYDNLILLTTVTDDINYSKKRGHSVIVASTPVDLIKDAVTLPIIEKEGFVKALVKIGIDEAKARIIAKDTARDINVFRRREGIMIGKPQWIDSLEDLLPAILVGKWMDNFEGDRSVLEVLSGMKYEQYETKLYAHLMEEETPLIHIGNMWRIRSPFESIEYVQTMFTTSVLNKFRNICINLIQDDDSEAVDKINPDDFQFRQFKQKYSNTIKEGVYQNLCLMSIVDSSNDKKLASWVDETVKELLKDWDLSRFLSNKHFMTALAEASPKEFLSFIEKLPKEILDVVFTPRRPKYSLFGWEISYTEVLFALEMLAWDVDYLSRVTNLLFRYSEYENESNYANKPINSLYHIYRFFMPQTHASFDERMTVLNAYASRYQSIVYKLCKKACESLNGCVLETNHYYRWRLFGKLKLLKYVNQVTIKQLDDVMTLMLQCCDYSPEAITDLISLSTQVSMGDVRMVILGTVREHLTKLEDVQIVAEALRKDIMHHKAYPDANWALNEAELKPYQNLLDEIEPKDILHKSAWLFESIYVQMPRKHVKGTDFEKERQKLLEIRNNAVREIDKTLGKNGIWNFIKMVKCPESMSESLVLLYGNSIINEVCQKYKSKEIGENFTRSYLSVLCHKDVEAYQALAKQIFESDNDLVVVLYAPGYIDSLAKMAASYGDSIRCCYWESVRIFFIEGGDVSTIVQELINVNRYSDAIEIIHSQGVSQMKEMDVVNVLYGYITHGTQSGSSMDMYYIRTILEELDKSEDTEVVQRLIMIEFLLFRALEHEMDVNNLRFIKELSHNPELMVQLLELAYVSDDGIVEQMEGVAAENRKVVGDCAFHILYFGRNLVSFKDDKGNLDESFMNQYIDQLYKLAKERKRSGVVDAVVGNILGDIPRDENYPPKALCEIVERLSSDKVDQHISIRLFNRGITGRSYNEGGVQERCVVAEFEKYRQKTKLLYPRMTKIFDDLIEEYKKLAGNEDVEASIADLEY